MSLPHPSIIRIELCEKFETHRVYTKPAIESACFSDVNPEQHVKIQNAVARFAHEIRCKVAASRHGHVHLRRICFVRRSSKGLITDHVAPLKALEKKLKRELKLGIGSLTIKVQIKQKNSRSELEPIIEKIIPDTWEDERVQMRKLLANFAIMGKNHASPYFDEDTVIVNIHVNDLSDQARVAWIEVYNREIDRLWNSIRQP